jgi:hypothetical protein
MRQRISYAEVLTCGNRVGVVLQDLVSPKAKIGVAFRSECPTEVRELIQALCDS